MFATSSPKGKAQKDKEDMPEILGVMTPLFLPGYAYASELVPAQYSDFTCRWISSLSYSEILSDTPRYFTWSQSQEMVYLGNTQQTFHGAGCLHFLALGTKKYTNCFVAVKSDFHFVLSSTMIKSPQMFRRHWSPLMLGNTLYFAKTYNHSKRYSHYMLQLYYVVSVQNTVVVAYLYITVSGSSTLPWLGT